MPTWDDLLRSAARLQELVPDAVLVGGTAAALHAGHRVSYDHDHVVAGLRDRYDVVLAALEDTDGWVTAREQRPVMVLGSLDGVETGVRNLIRTRPLEVEDVDVPGGGRLRIPTLPEALRVKAWLVLRRNATRDHLDVAARAGTLGDGAPAVLAGMDDYYDVTGAPTDDPVATQVIRQLAEPAPYDLDEVELPRYRELDRRWQDWASVADALADLSTRTLDAYTSRPSGREEGPDAAPSPGASP